MGSDSSEEENTKNFDWQENKPRCPTTNERSKAEGICGEPSPYTGGLVYRSNEKLRAGDEAIQYGGYNFNEVKKIK